jgi:glutathione-specific gamma-glutamylcyclotransferase
MKLPHHTIDKIAYFGYGSLVNELTWARPYKMEPAELRNWAREWNHCVDTPFGRVCALTVSRSDFGRVQGVFIRSTRSEIIEVDDREIGYVREAIPPSDIVTHKSSLPPELYIYRSEERFRRGASDEYPLWLSYVDCVIVGYLKVFGKGGVDTFIASTEGWRGPILDDRAKPLYPRAVRLSEEERQFIDERLGEIKGLKFIPA